MLSGRSNDESVSLLLRAGARLGSFHYNDGNTTSVLQYIANLNLTTAINNLVNNISNISFKSQNDFLDLKDVVSDLNNAAVRSHLTKKNTLLAAVLISLNWRQAVEEFNTRVAITGEYIPFNQSEVRRIEELRMIKNRVADVIQVSKSPNYLTEGEVLKAVVEFSRKMVEHYGRSNLRPFESREFVEHNYPNLSRVQNNLIKSVLMTMQSTGVAIREANPLDESRVSNNHRRNDRT